MGAESEWLLRVALDEGGTAEMRYLQDEVLASFKNGERIDMGALGLATGPAYRGVVLFNGPTDPADMRHQLALLNPEQRRSLEDRARLRKAIALLKRLRDASRDELEGIGVSGEQLWQDIEAFLEVERG